MTEQTEGAEVETLAGLLSGAAPEFVHLAIPTHLEQARRLLASDWLAAREAAAYQRGRDEEFNERLSFGCGWSWVARVDGDCHTAH